MPTPAQLAAGDPALAAAVQRARKLLNRRALTGAAASVVPVPGLGWMVDAALLSQLLPAINLEFGLTPEQLDRLPKHKREEVQRAVGVVGSLLIGKLVTKELVIRTAAAVGKRMTVKQAAKYVPIAGQVVAAVLGYTALRYLGEKHIQDCVRVCQEAHLKLPAPQGS